jgi:hypothetical protein
VLQFPAILEPGSFYFTDTYNNYNPVIKLKPVCINDISGNYKK